MKHPVVDIQKDIDKINSIPIISSILEVVCKTTGMGFAAVARVTDTRWVTCSSRDELEFGLRPGDELELETTLCNKIRQSQQPILIENVKEDQIYCFHPTPKKYGFQSYISVPLFKKDGAFFGTLCCIDPKPKKVKNDEILKMFRLFTELISFHLNVIEELKITEDQLSKELKTSELRDQFISILGHDLKNPVGSTRMSSELLMKMPLDERSLKYVEVIHNSSYRMQGLIDNILDFARGKLGDGIQLEKTSNKVGLKKNLQQVISEIKVIAPQREINIHFDIQEEVNCDENRVAQLFSNLLGNAIHHSEENTPVIVDISSNNESFKLKVTNNGEISKNTINHLFQPFYRENIHPEKQGLGLGLYISSEIAKAHHGELRVNSSKNLTSFTFSIPSL